MKLFKQFLVLCLVVTLFGSVTNVQDVSAETIQGLNEKLSALVAKKEASNQKVNETKKNIESSNAQIAAAIIEVEEKSATITENFIQIDVLETDKKEKDEDIKDLLVYNQLNRNVNEGVTFIIETDSIVDSIHRNNVVEQLTSKSSSKIDEFIAIQDELTVANEQMEKDIEDLEKKQDELEKLLVTLNSDLEQYNEYGLSIDEEISQLRENIKYYEKLGCGKTEDLEACKLRVSVTVPNASGFVSPMGYGYITSEYGWRWGRIHRGIDISTGGAPPIYAAADGVVSAVGYSSSLGNYVCIQHIINGEKFTTAYFHMNSWPSVYKGQPVTVDSVLGYMGTTGNSTGPHLHFEILKNWTSTGAVYPTEGLVAQNPRSYLSYPGLMVYWEGRNR